MSDRVQVGARVDAALWEEFREQVESRHGQTRGSLGDELENAIRNYIHFGADKSVPDQLAEMNTRLQRLEGEVGTAAADGGTDSLAADEHTHAPSRLDVTEKPAANAATDKKVAWLAEQVGSNPESIPRAKLRDIVKDEYGFRSDTAKRYVERLIDHFDLVDDPTADSGILVSQDRREEILEQRRADLEAEADAELEEVVADD
jgi:hypothetical protein